MSLIKISSLLGLTTTTQQQKKLIGQSNLILTACQTVVSVILKNPANKGYFFYCITAVLKKSSDGVMAHVLDCEILISEYKIVMLSCSLSYLYPCERYETPSYKSNSTTTVLPQG